MLFQQLQPLKARSPVTLGPPVKLLLPQFIGVHGGVSHDDNLVAGVKILQKPLRGGLAVLPQPGAVVEVAVDAVVEIVGVQLLEVVGSGGRLKQLAAQAGIVIHGAAGIHQHQNLDGVFPGIFITDFQPPCVLAGIVDGGVHIQFLFGALLLCGQLPQGAESHLELAGIQRVVLAEVPELPLPRHHHGGAVHGLAADPQTVGVPAAVAPRGKALRSHPVPAAVVLLRLLLQLLLQPPQQRFQILLREARPPQLLHRAAEIIAGMVQPVHQLLRQLAGIGYILEKFQKHLIEAVKFRFAFHHNGPAQVVKSRQGGVVQALFHALQQRHPLVQGNVQPPLTQQVKKRGEHGYFTFRRV